MGNHPAVIGCGVSFVGLISRDKIGTPVRPVEISPWVLKSGNPCVLCVPCVPSWSSSSFLIQVTACATASSSFTQLATACLRLSRPIICIWYCNPKSLRSREGELVVDSRMHGGER